MPAPTSLCATEHACSIHARLSQALLLAFANAVLCRVPHGQFLADTSCALSKALDLTLDGVAGPLRALGGLRSKRFALYVDNGTVKHVAVSEGPDDATGDEPGANYNSSAAGMIEAIKAL